uniref:Ycf20-like protein n=1 Tax=Anthurium amnicola TaxID=1678845 RepID=A0A1D1YYM9_9ARAE
MSSIQNFSYNIILPSSRYSRSSVMLLGHKIACHFSQRLSPQHCFLCKVALHVNNSRYMSSSVKSMVGDGNADPPGSDSDGGPRLVREIQSLQTKLSARLEKLKKDWPMKVLFFLVGFYCATAFATVIGQTGDWDILSAGLAVVIVEGIGALMYRASFPLREKIRGLITMFNYWKAGLSLGLFLDAFKYEIDRIFEPCDPFNINIDIFPTFW